MMVVVMTADSEHVLLPSLRHYDDVTKRAACGCRPVAQRKEREPYKLRLSRVRIPPGLFFVRGAKNGRARE